jgi:hypothetical protein
MKVIAINGSPRKDGNTAILLIKENGRTLYINLMTTISGFVSMRMGGPQVPAPLEV